jgi:hypothetical protein
MSETNTSIDYGTTRAFGLMIKHTEEASHASNPSLPNAWTARGLVTHGSHESTYGVIGLVQAGEPCRVIWDFSDAEVAAAGEDASLLPFDDEHVFAVQPA